MWPSALFVHPSGTVGRIIVFFPQPPHAVHFVRQAWAAFLFDVASTPVSGDAQEGPKKVPDIENICTGAQRETEYPRGVKNVSGRSLLTTVVRRLV